MSSKPLAILGLSYFGNHESAAALLTDGKLIAAAEEERFTRKKYDRSFPSQSISFCLKQGGINIKEVNHVGFFWQPWRGFGKKLIYALKGLPYSFFRGAKNAGILYDLISAEKIFRNQTGYTGNFHFIEHHLAHASSVFFSSGLQKSAILSVDGSGESITCWMGRGEANRLTNLKTVKWPHSLGHLYSTLTQYLGFKVFEDEYKVMGLSSYGAPEYLDEFRKIIKIRNDKTYEIDLSYTDYQLFKKRWYSEKWIRKFGSPRQQNEPINKRHQNIAASLQVRLEEVLKDLAAYLIDATGSDSLCLSGGVALNSLAVGKLSEMKIAKIYTNPVSGDAGCALGAAYFINNVILNNNNQPLKHAFWGPEYQDEEIEKILVKRGVKYEKLENPSQKAAELLAQGKIIGWFQGRAEHGQRALGNRSILADPRNKSIKDIINMKIKHREPFRPFAPSILEEFQSEYFDYSSPVPFMTEVHFVKQEKQKLIPAVVHVDGTARLQTVNKSIQPLFWNLIYEFYKLTNIPVVLNTSFNTKGEPIVNSPHDAIDTFYKSGLDDLIIGKFLVRSSY